MDRDFIIQTRNLLKIFSSNNIQTIALNNVNFSVKEKEFVAIMGPSGCGKSTLLHIVGMLDSLTSGQCFFLNQDVSSLNERKRTIIRKENIGFVFQSFNLIDELTVYENVELPLIYAKINSTTRKKRVSEMLERMKLTHRSNHFPQQLSGGQQQRVAIVRAVINQPKLILADEPTGNLDSINGDEVMNLLTELNQEGAAIVMVTHSQIEADKSHRIVQLFDGHIVTENYKRASNRK